MNREEFVRLLGREKGSAILRTNDQETAASAMEAAVRGGFRIIEFTLTIPGAFELISDFSRRDGLVVGAGTVMTPDEAERAVESGASFLVSPVVDRAVIETSNRLGVASMPGTHTPTEMLLAHRSGAPLCKLFPAPAGGPAWVRSVLGPMSFLKIVPTNGVDADNAGDWIEAGAWAVGFVAPLFESLDLEARRWDAVEDRARACLASLRGFEPA